MIHKIFEDGDREIVRIQEMKGDFIFSDVDVDGATERTSRNGISINKSATGSQ